ncbi:pyrroline-5-carboxylate reductase [Moritella sp. 24]|uniref:pyrroline-5-carboxylate reductase n=1 Tax=Moritella sp. 24 TaxID=2746230 RepID=UPI001BA95850|nr:pyrroline-5-carboxylate reductase [Moritella sp. 24]QUM78143.1 pyrroline-5-carboxylate reductase [Moritella sp. 24]
MITNKKIAFIGAGNMASSLIGGMITDGYPAELIYAANPTRTRLDVLAEKFSINTTQDNNHAVASADIIFLAVKPQLMAEVCSQLAEHSANYRGKLFVSVAAGVTVERLQSLLADNQPIVRTMPNTPALVQKGMTGLFPSPEVSDDEIKTIDKIMTAVGKTCWVEDESDLNTITAATGSSPAYFFLFMEAMQESIIRMGFTQQQARELVQQAALGSAELVQQNPHIDLATLRQNVTSKGGTTAEAIRTFEEHNLRDTVDTAMQAAVTRAEQMSKLF